MHAVRTLLAAGALVGALAAAVASANTTAPDARAASPAELRIAAAQSAIAANPESATHFAALAQALARRARETADGELYDQATAAAQSALKLDPEHFEAHKAVVWATLGKHEWARALELARKLNQKAPDDIQVYGFLVDAQVELGRYDEAEAAAQWMLDLRPGNVPALTRAAYLRELTGDAEGALEFMQMALTRTPQIEREDRAWLLTHVSHLYLALGQTESAGQAVAEALKVFPGYHYALAQEAKVRHRQGKSLEAVVLLQRRFDAASHPENRFELAAAQQAAGLRDAARKSFAAFEAEALAESESEDNANRELIRYWLEFAKKPKQALQLSTRQFARQQDVHTRLMHAWALARSGDNREAWAVIEPALKLGWQDAQLYRQAGQIAKQLGRKDRARQLLAKAQALTEPSAKRLAFN